MHASVIWCIDELGTSHPASYLSRNRKRTHQCPAPVLDKRAAVGLQRLRAEGRPSPGRGRLRGSRASAMLHEEMPAFSPVDQDVCVLHLWSTFMEPSGQSRWSRKGKEIIEGIRVRGEVRCHLHLQAAQNSCLQSNVSQVWKQNRLARDWGGKPRAGRGPRGAARQVWRAVQARA